MKYDIKEFDRAVEYYKGVIKKISQKNILIVSDVRYREAFFSFAPLTRAIHELNKEVHIVVKNKKSPGLDVLLEVLKTYQDLEHGVDSEKTRALGEFIKITSKRVKDFRRLFEWPYIIDVELGFNGMEFKSSWFKERMPKQLEATCDKIWREVYNLKAKEKVSIGFETIPKKSEMELPLEDYLDSYAIIWKMMESCKAEASMGTATPRASQLEFAERISSLKSCLLGCELSKNVNMAVFKKFKKLSKLLRIDRLEIASASFFIHGKGYGGRLHFGEAIGYPSPDRKTKWTSPAGIIYKLDWSPQTKIDKRSPKARVAFTETLPIEVFVETNNIDWAKMVKRTRKIKGVIEGCSKILVKGRKFKGLQTDLTVDLIKEDGTRRWVRADDGRETRKIIHKKYLKKKVIKAGAMSNIPAGEVFVTPQSMTGIFIGDVIINIDRSYILRKPFVVKTLGNSYKILHAQKEILDKFNKRKMEAWKNLLIQEKNKSLPKSIIELRKRNFNNIGEFAINTNPEARLSNYLIVNEKIANMIHIALGSGFEPDRETVYHMDIVINAPKQRLDIYGLKGKKKVWILKKGKFVV